MTAWPREIYPVAAVREIDRSAIEDHGISGYELMNRAATAAIEAATARFPSARHCHVVCGAGNNAGDGYAYARLAAQRGQTVSVSHLVDPAALGGDAATAYRDFIESSGSASAWTGAVEPAADLLVDAMLGSGLDRPVEGSFADAVSCLNDSTVPVVALDVPTGLNGDTGAVMGACVDAAMTVTFVGLKAGLFLGNGASQCGEIVFADLDIPAACRKPEAAALRRICDGDIRSALTPRRRDGHKGDFGHVLVVGGGPGMPGAARLCGEAALRTGAGLVSLATHPDHAAAITANRPELMAHGVDSKAGLAPLLDAADVVAFGPGLGQSDWSLSMYTAVVEAPLPAIWDADALNLLAGRLPVDKAGGAGMRVVTPHPGEAARILGTTTGDVQAGRLHSVSALAEVCGCTAVLKGANTLVSAASGAPWVCTAGNPGMASPGMGDVLTGVIAALAAQGLPLDVAARIGVAVHAQAGDMAAAGGERGLIASDLLAEIRGVVNP